MTFSRSTTRNAGIKVLRATNGAASLAQLKVVRANLLSDEWFKKLAHFSRVLDRVRDVEGDVVECGVAAGKSFAIIASLVRASGRKRCVWGFDSWCPPPPDAGEGLPAEIAYYGATMAEVRLRLRQMDFDDLTGIRLVQIDLCSALPDTPERIAFVHLDIPFAEPYRICFAKLWQRLEPGGIVALGGYGYTDAGARETLATVAAEAAQFESDPAWHDRGFIVKS
jgi:Macrocin-O-methyltransferase (TylF)